MHFRVEEFDPCYANLNSVLVGDCFPRLKSSMRSHLEPIAVLLGMFVRKFLLFLPCLSLPYYFSEIEHEVCEEPLSTKCGLFLPCKTFYLALSGTQRTLTSASSLRFTPKIVASFGCSHFQRTWIHVWKCLLEAPAGLQASLGFPYMERSIIGVPITARPVPTSSTQLPCLFKVQRASAISSHEKPRLQRQLWFQPGCFGRSQPPRAIIAILVSSPS